MYVSGSILNDAHPFFHAWPLPLLYLATSSIIVRMCNKEFLVSQINF
jgi:hypothetical protein